MIQAKSIPKRLREWAGIRPLVMPPFCNQDKRSTSALRLQAVGCTPTVAVWSATSESTARVFRVYEALPTLAAIIGQILYTNTNQANPR